MRLIDHSAGCTSHTMAPHNPPMCDPAAVEPAPHVRDEDYESWCDDLGVTYPRLETCGACHGTGRDPFADRHPLPCFRCDGVGAVIHGAGYNGATRGGC